MTGLLPVAARPPWSLQARLLLTVLGLVTGIWIVAAVATWFDTRHELNELLDGHLAQAASFLVTQTVDELDGDDFPLAPVLHPYQPRVAFQVWHEGRLVVKSANAPAVPLGTRVSPEVESHTVDGRDWLVMATRGREADVVIYVGEFESARRDVLLASLRGVLWPFAIALPLLAVAIWWAVRGSVQPLRRLSAEVAQRRPQALQPMPLDATPPEVEPLVQALNGLFERVGHMLESERRFNADAAHELRTPIAGIRMQAQVALGAGSDAERNRALAATLQGCDRATHLVEQLLQLSRLEGEPAHASPSAPRVDLAAVATRQAGGLQVLSHERHQTLKVESPSGPLQVVMDPALAGVLVRNLLDNALRYSPVGGQVRLVVGPGASGQPRIVVEDSGPGMAPEEIARLGERFYRVLGSDAAGSGLGWSIVQRIARLYGLEVDVGRSDDLGGLRVRVGWPVTPTPAA